MWDILSGEGGIRTHVPLRETRSPGVRARPDYATSPGAFAEGYYPARRGGLYYIFSGCGSRTAGKQEKIMIPGVLIAGLS